MGDEGAAVSNCLLCDSYALLTLGLLPNRKVARGIKAGRRTKISSGRSKKSTR